MMKVFKTLAAAKKVANGLPIIRIGKLHLVGTSDLLDLKMTQVEIIAPCGTITGHIGLGHLDRLGNGNWAVATKPSVRRAFDQKAPTQWKSDNAAA